jgi:CheY-like chemotaxis protein
MSRALSGSLDDVDLDEVLRVVALSRRSGLLDVVGPETQVEMHFVGGRLVRVRMHDAVETVGDLLARHAILDAPLTAPAGETIEALVARVEARSGLRQVLVRVDDILSSQMTDAVRRVLGWRSGSFAFRVTPDSSPPLRYTGDTAWTLPAGLDVEDLVREARRRRQERASDPLFGIVAQPRSARRTEPPGRPELLVVDDDPAFLAGVEQTLGDIGVPVLAMSSAQRAIDRVVSAVDDGLGAIVVDLVMPRSNGRGILGGLELIRAAHDAGVGGRCFLVVDGQHDDAEALATSLGATVLRRPTSRETLGELLNPVLARLQRPALPVAGFDLARELSRELADDERAEWQRTQRAQLDEGIKNLETLKALLGELNHPSFEEEIPLLLLRFASAFFARGALFSVDPGRQELVGLGGFGVGGSDPGRIVRSIRIPLAADTIFARAVAERCGVRQPIWDSEWNARFLNLIGGQRPREVYAAPLISPRGLEAVLYADNGTEPRPFPDIALLEIFLQQAAAALERATLARELQVLRDSRIPAAVS